MSVPEHELEEPSERQRYCALHDCTYGWGCPECRDLETQRREKEQRESC